MFLLFCISLGVNHLTILLSFSGSFHNAEFVLWVGRLILDGTGLLLFYIILFSLSVTMPLCINYVVASTQPPGRPTTQVQNQVLDWRAVPSAEWWGYFRSSYRAKQVLPLGLLYFLLPPCRDSVLQSHSFKQWSELFPPPFMLRVGPPGLGLYMGMLALVPHRTLVFFLLQKSLS